MNKAQYEAAASNERAQAATMLEKAEAHKGMAEETHYRFFATNALNTAAWLDQRALQQPSDAPSNRDVENETGF